MTDRAELLASLERHHEECNQDDGPGCDTRQALDLLAAVTAEGQRDMRVMAAEVAVRGKVANERGEEIRRLRASLAKVRELHRPDDVDNCVSCSHEIGPGNPRPGGRWDCAHNDRIVEWPCPTIQALGEADHDG